MVTNVPGKGKRTYAVLGFMVVTAILGAVELNGSTILSSEITAAMVTILGALAAYFRSEATK
jgi:hypothetical protein